MRFRFGLVVTIMFSVCAWGVSMNPQYSHYINRSSDATHIYATAVVDGTTSGCDTCPPTIKHTGKVYLQIGTVSGWVYGSPVTPKTYISVSNAKTTAAVANTNYPSTETWQVSCTYVGTNFYYVQENPGPLLRIVDTNFILEGWDAKTCQYMFWCPNGSAAASCKAIQVLDYTPDSPAGSGACIPYNYLHTHDLVVGGVCTYIGEADLANTPIPCT